MDPSQNLLPNDQRHDDGIVALVPRKEPTGVEARSGGPTRDANDQHVSVTVSNQDGAPLTQPSLAPSAKSFELMNHLDALVRDFAVAGRCDSSDQRIGKAQEGASVSLGMEKVESSIRGSPRPAALTNEQSASDKASTGGRTVLTFAGFIMVALIGVGATIAWQSSHTAEPTGFNPAPRRSSDTALQQSADTLTTTVSAASATSPQPVQQLQAMAHDLTAMRNDLKHLAVEQEHLAVMQQQFEQLAAAQQQLAAKQEQTAQNLARLQAIERNIRQKRSLASLPRAVVPMPPRRNAPANATPKSSTQASSAPHPLPPAPVPP